MSDESYNSVKPWHIKWPCCAKRYQQTPVRQVQSTAKKLIAGIVGLRCMNSKFGLETHVPWQRTLLNEAPRVHGECLGSRRKEPKST